MLADDGCDNGDDADFFFLLVVCIQTPPHLPFITPLLHPVVVPSDVPPQLPGRPHLSSLCPHHYTCGFLYLTFKNSKLGQSISKVLVVGRYIYEALW